MTNTKTNNFREELAEVAIRKEILRENSVEAISGRHAILMLEEISRILDDKKLSMEDTYNAIMKIICFYDVPPHV